LIKKYKIDLVGFNADYTPYSIERDKKIQQIAECRVYHDLCINDPTSIKPYKVFTPYYNIASKKKVPHPIKNSLQKVIKLPEKSVNLFSLKKQAESIISKNGADLELIQSGGRTQALKCLKSFSSRDYKNRDLLTFETSRIGPHLKFGTVSVREVYLAYTKEIFRRQLYWRDFYLQISYHFPHVFKYNFRNEIAWKNSKTLFKKWTTGETGVDIVDACMNQLNKSGFMHNRGRMIVASYLTKILHIDWRWGERYFASRLTDYDPSNNNGGWQWSAGTGSDAQPYFRIFNPYTQQKKFDPTGEYVDKWLGRPASSLEPIADYEKERKVALQLIK